MKSNPVLAFLPVVPYPIGECRRRASSKLRSRYRINGCAKPLNEARWPLPEEPTPITPISFRGRTWYVKRDDKLNFMGITGSKLRKLHELCFSNLDEYDSIVSYGGAMSNAMLAVSRLCHYRQKQFIYITRQIPKHLSFADGNFRQALDLNMIHIEIGNNLFRSTFTDVPPQTIYNDILLILQKDHRTAAIKSPYFIPQGVASPSAEYGVRILANEISAQISQMRTEGRLVNKRPVLFLPCGTGATAYYLAKHLVDSVQVVAVPVSGSESYLIKQMRWLSQSQGNKTPILNEHFPNVIRPRLRASFADVRPEKLSIWQELGRSTKHRFQFDLIYAPKAWEEVVFAIEQGRVANNGEDIFYYHTGGVEGNVSMLGKLKSLFVCTIVPQMFF